MSYVKDLDEYTDAELQAELEQRKNDRNAGKCDYCHRHYTETTCRFKERHAAPGARRA